MSTIKKLFGAGDQQDDELLYGAEPKKTSLDKSSSLDKPSEVDSQPAVHDQSGHGSAAAVPVTEESKPTTTETALDKEDDGEDSKSKGLLSKILPSKKDKDSEEPTDDTKDSDNRAAETAAVGTSAAAGTTAAAAARGEDKPKDEETEPQKDEETKKKGFLSKIFSSKKDKEPDASSDKPVSTTSTTENRAVEPTTADSQIAKSTTDDRHLERDTAIGAGAIGATGTGAAVYEHNKSDPQDSSLQQDRAVESAPKPDTSYETSTGAATDDSHFGRDAALGAGALGAAGAGTAVYEHDKSDQHESKAAQSDPIESTPKTGATYETTSGSTTDDSHFGRDAAIGAGAVGATGAGAAAYDRHESKPTPITVTGDESTPVAPTEDSHLERDAAIGAGVLGATGVGAAAYEHHHQAEPTPAAGIESASAPRSAADDDVSKATYTERSYPLAGGSTSDHPLGATSTEESHLGRDAAIAGGAAGVAGLGTYAATRGNDDLTPETKAQDIQNPEQVDSASRFSPHVPGEFPTEDGRDPHSVTPMNGTAPQTHSGTDDATTAATIAAAGAGGAATSTYGAGSHDGIAPASQGNSYYGRPPASSSLSQPSTQSEFAKPADEEHHYGRDAALAGAGAAVLGGGTYAATRHDDGPTTTSDVADTSVATHTKEPVEQERHYGRDTALAGAGAAVVGSGAYAATRHDDMPSTTSNIADTSTAADTQKPIDEDHHYGTDAAVAGAGVTGVGGGAYGASRYDDQDATSPNVTGPTTTRATSEPTEHEHHYGRDAAVAGGAGAAGVAATEAWRDHDRDTGPAPNTLGPHDSDIKNVMDPRVQPDLSQQSKEPESTAHTSKVANILDPRVKDSSPTDTKADEEHSKTPSYGRDGAMIAATTAMEDNRVSTDDHGHSHLHKKSEERQGEKKPGFISRLLHRDKKEKENEEPSSSASGEGRHFAGASAAREIEDQKTAGLPSSEGNATGLPVGDDGMIHIVKEGSHPDDPHMVISGDGSAVFNDRE